MENGYHIYDFKGEMLREEPVEKFKQWSWRPRPATLLTKEEQKQIRKNLREYSRQFEEEDAQRITGANQEIIDMRREKYREWLDFRAMVEEDAAEEREALGLPEASAVKTTDSAEEEQVIEEIVEEVIEESEEIVSQ